jgi:hypothetical protein
MCTIPHNIAWYIKKTVQSVQVVYNIEYSTYPKKSRIYRYNANTEIKPGRMVTGMSKPKSKEYRKRCE